MANYQGTPEMGGTGEPFPIVAPLLGLNTRDDYTALKPQEARILENWLPDGGACKVRPGYDEHQEIEGATSVPVLTVWKGEAGSALIAAADGELWDVSSTPDAITTNANYTSNRWSTVTFNDWLFGVNGTDSPFRYDGGGAVAATGFTGPTLTSLNTVNQVRGRLWFTANDTSTVYYGGAGSVTGALTSFSLGQIASGGKCVGIGSWSRDAGDGSDDMTVFIMSTGELLIYQGDPQKSFEIVGKFDCPAPVGLDPYVKVGGELVILTVSGPVPVSAAIAGTAFDPFALDKWGKIAPSWAADWERHGANLGWSGHFFGGLVYFVIPTSTSTTKVYVINTRNGAPTLYTKMPVGMFANMGGTLYFGSHSDGFVYRHGTGSDNGAQIITLARQGWSYPGGSNRSNQITMMRPHISASGPCQAQFQVDVDFRESQLSAPIIDILSFGEGSQWDEDQWDVGQWGAEGQSRAQWFATVGRGRAVAPVMRTYSTSDIVEWSTTELISKPGGIL